MSVQLYLGDCLEVMRGMQAASVDLVVTSPPYDNLRAYGDDFDADSFDWMGIIDELYRLTKPGGVVVWVVCDATIEGSETGTSFEQALWARQCGFNLHDTMIYEIAGTGAKGSNYAYWQSFEYMFVWSKGKPKTVNRIADVKNTVGGKRRGFSPKAALLGSRVNRPFAVGPVWSVRPNVWRYAGRLEDTLGHPAPFPLSLATDHIVSWSNPGDVVLDPMLGSGTTGVGAVREQRNFIGIEIDPTYLAIATKRITEAQMQPMLLEAI